MYYLFTPSVCVCWREREIRECVCVCWRERKRERECVCERERERVCVSVCVCTQDFLMMNVSQACSVKSESDFLSC